MSVLQDVRYVGVEAADQKKRTFGVGMVKFCATEGFSD